MVDIMETYDKVNTEGGYRKMTKKKKFIDMYLHDFDSDWLRHRRERRG